MYSHAEIWQAIDRLAQAFGYSPSGLAKKAGLDPTAFNKSKRTNADGKPRWPSTESIAKILAVTGASMSDFFGLIDTLAHDTAAGAQASDSHGGATGQHTAKTLGNRNPASRRDGAPLPFLSLEEARAGQHFDNHGQPKGKAWESVTFPAIDAAHAVDALYALEMTDNSFGPLYRQGDVLILSPVPHLRRGDRVLVRTKDGEITIKELTRQTAARVDLKALTPADLNLSLEPDDILWMARILWVSQ